MKSISVNPMCTSLGSTGAWGAASTSMGGFGTGILYGMAFTGLPDHFCVRLTPVIDLGYPQSILVSYQMPRMPGADRQVEV